VQPPAAGSELQRRHQLEPRVEVVLVAAPLVTAVGVDVGAQRPCDAQQRDLGRIPKRLVVALKPGVIAVGAGSRERAEAKRHRPRAKPRSSLTARPSVHASTGRIRFSVNVPVLSVQITSVEPSVSTALSA